MWSDPRTSQRKVIGNNNNDGFYFERDNTRVHHQYMCLDDVVKGKNYNWADNPKTKLQLCSTLILAHLERCHLTVFHWSLSHRIGLHAF